MRATLIRRIDASLTATTREWDTDNRIEVVNVITRTHQPASIAAMTETDRLTLVEELRQREHITVARRFVSDATPDYYYDSQRWQRQSRAGQFRREWLRYLTEEGGLFE